MRGFGTDGRPLRTQTSRWLSEAARSAISTSPGPALGIGRVLVAEHLGPAVLVDPNRLHRAQSLTCRRPRLERLAEELGIDVVGAAPAEPYDETERHIRERRARGLFADMRFTMAQPEVSCHPETLLAGARTVVSAALCYYAPTAGAAGRARGGCRATPGATRYAGAAREARRARPAARRRATACSSTRTSTSTARRRRASGVGFYGKNTMLITRRHGSWVVLGTLVTDVEVEPTPPLDARLRLVHALHRRVPDRRARRAGHARRDALPLVLDAGAAADPGGVPRGARRPGLRLRHLPGRLPVEPRRREAARGEPLPPDAEPHVSLVDWLEADGDELAGRYDRLYVPRNDPRYLRGTRSSRSATSGGRSTRLVAGFAETTTLLREHAEWALARIGERGADGERRAPARRRALDRAGSAWAPCRSRSSRSQSRPRLSRRLRAAGPGSTTGVSRGRRRCVLFWLSRRDWPERLAEAARLRRARLRHRDRLRVHARSTFEPGRRSGSSIYLRGRGGAPLRDRRRARRRSLASAPVLVAFEWLRERRLARRSFHLDYVTLPARRRGDRSA